MDWKRLLHPPGSHDLQALEAIATGEIDEILYGGVVTARRHLDSRQRQEEREGSFPRPAAAFGLRLMVRDDLAPILEGFVLTLQVMQRIEVVTDQSFPGCE
jgi:hypothetical protein